MYRHEHANVTLVGGRTSTGAWKFYYQRWALAGSGNVKLLSFNEVTTTKAEFLDWASKSPPAGLTSGGSDPEDPRFQMDIRRLLGHATRGGSDQLPGTRECRLVPDQVRRHPTATLARYGISLDPDAGS